MGTGGGGRGRGALSKTFGPLTVFSISALFQFKNKVGGGGGEGPSATV